MKKNIRLGFLLLLSLVIPAFAWNFFKEKRNTETKKIVILPSKSSVFIALTGYSSERNAITSIELNDLYCAGNVYVLKSVYPYYKEYINSISDVKKKRECKVPVLLESLNDFSPIAKNKILITDLDNLNSIFKTLLIDSVNFFENPDKYKFISGDKVDYKNQLTKYTMTGVTAITRAAGRTADREGIDFLTKNLKPYFQNSDYVHISNEVSFKDSCEYIAGTTRFCTKEIHFKALTDLNCNIVELTGNHNRDYGDKAYRKTYQWYKDNNIKIFGGGTSPEEANTPLAISLKGGKRLGLIGFNEACPLGECARKQGEVGANFYEKEKAKAVIRKIKEELKADYIIASVQFTEWDKYEPHGTQVRIAHELIDFGADFVYGSQAHQIQQVEFYKGKPIFYGLGNFLFDQIHHTAVRQAFFLNHYFYKGKLVQTFPVYIFMRENRQQSIATREEREAMQKAIFIDSLLYRKF
jgi:poly-gamma-glutamate capsule biosynthesis protein CapA/YwtB (metallophosphatase superfamily)